MQCTYAPHSNDVCDFLFVTAVHNARTTSEIYGVNLFSFFVVCVCARLKGTRESDPPNHNWQYITSPFRQHRRTLRAHWTLICSSLNWFQTKTFPYLNFKMHPFCARQRQAAVSLNFIIALTNWKLKCNSSVKSATHTQRHTHTPLT